MEPMNNIYKIYIDDSLIAELRSIEYALILIKAIYSEFYTEPKLEIKIRREDNSCVNINC